MKFTIIILSCSLGSIFYQCVYIYMVLFLFNTVICVFLLLSVYSHCVYVCLPWQVSPCFFLSCKPNAKVKPAKTGLCLHSSYVLRVFCFVSVCVLFVCICILYYCHRVATKLQLTNISSYIAVSTSHNVRGAKNMGTRRTIVIRRDALNVHITSQASAPEQPRTRMPNTNC
jgi:hypothetical protein